MKPEFVSVIFNEKPMNWGLRGDPYFWDCLARHFENTRLPCPPERFTDEFYACFERVTGQKLTRKISPYVSDFAHGGLSGGRVCGAYWMDYGLPELLKRLDSANSQVQS